HEAVARGNGVGLRLTTDMNVGFEGSLATSRTLLKQGESRFVALSWSEHAAPSSRQEAQDLLVWTVHHWPHWLARGRFPDHPWRSHLQRSALTLKGLPFAPSGAVAAAATTSLPETPGGDRNWDYRYTWIRDSTMALWAFYTLGYDWEANDFFYFITDVAEAAEGKLQIMHGLDGREELPASTLDHLSGYDDARPVRIGNDAYMQAQHEVRGAIRGSIYLVLRKRARPGLPTSAATTTPVPSGSATTRTGRRSTTCGARSSAPSTCSCASATASTPGSGRSSSSRWRTRSPTGASPTAACGRCAASRSTSPRPRSSAGSRPTAAPVSPASAATGSARGAGRPPPTRSTPTCWPTRWTSGASSPRTTARRPWTP